MVLAPRRTGYSARYAFEGDLYRPEYGVAEPDIHYATSYTETGFRVNSSEPPFEIVVLGDSLVMVGEDDASTLSERLRVEMNVSTFNLGRGWYGPFQYLEVFMRYGLALKPGLALFCFFAGNDIEDIRQYQRWREHRVYYFYEGQLSRGFFHRYVTALSDTGAYLRERLRIPPWQLGRRDHRLSTSPARANAVHPALGVIRVGGNEVPMAFAYWNQEGSAQRLLESEEWQTLRTLFQEFRRLCLANGIEPVLVYIPTKIQVYGPYASAESGQSFKQKLAAHAPYRTNVREALQTLARELNMSLVDLLPHFERLSAEGHLLYHPFDTHWNKAGIHAAAEHIASSLAVRERTRPDR